MAIKINGEIVSSRRIQSYKTKILKGKILNKNNKIFDIGVDIYYIGSIEEKYDLFEGKIVEILKDGKIKVSVYNRNIKKSNDFIEKIVDKNILKLNNKS